jgi:hypothetical protein
MSVCRFPGLGQAGTTYTVWLEPSSV